VQHSVGNFHLEGYELHYRIQPGDVVIDGGGFQGVFTLYAAMKAGPTGRVVVFEPDERLARLLEKNVRLNQLTNVTIVRKGLWSEEATLRFDARGNTSRLELEAGPSHLIATVPVTSLDREVARLGLDRVNFIKMNIEGAEIEAVAGCLQTMQRCAPSFAIASDHIRDGEPTARRVIERLKARGYEAFSDYPQHLTVYGSKPLPTPP
jgi:FkbM family methyltransferase